MCAHPATEIVERVRTLCVGLLALVLAEEESDVLARGSHCS